MENNRTELLRKIKDEIVAGKHLPLYSERLRNNVFPVIGEGSHYAKIMFIGEAPGKNEAETGRPFCGAAGRILDELLESAGIPRKEVYITNIVKDRPPMNRDPFPEEIEAYAPYLDRQLGIIQPQVIATLGRFSMAYIMNKFGLGSRLESISRIHGKIFEALTTETQNVEEAEKKTTETQNVEEKTEKKGARIKIIPLYHPAVAVYNSNMKEALLKDFQILKQWILF